METFLFEQIGSTYTRQRSYKFPAVTLPPKRKIYVGIRGQRYKRWLKANHRVLYYHLLTSSKLNEQTAEVDKRAENLFFRLVQEMAKREGVAESLKAADLMA